jgi:hypothetical protein
MDSKNTACNKNRLCIRSAILIFLAAVMLIGGAAYFVRGVYWAWIGTNFNFAPHITKYGDDCDLQSRAGEFSEFSKGIYPNKRVQRPDKPKAKNHTVYPPYALPMFGVFFGFWNYETGRLILQAGSLLALIIMMIYGGKSLSRFGLAAVLIGMALPWAFSGNRVAMSAGQFSIICAALLVLQIYFQTKGREFLAGVCWAFAMIKPQIALPFAILFMMRNQVLGLFWGGAILTLLSGFALWWTDLNPIDFLRDGPLSEGMKFVANHSHSAGVWINALGISPRIATLGAVLLVVLLGLGAWFFGRRIKIPLLTGAAICAVLGYALFYHRLYDNIMLYPLALALAGSYFRRGFSKIEWLFYGAFFVSVFLPGGVAWASESTMASFAMVAPALAILVFLVANRMDASAKKETILAPPYSR